MTSEDSFEVVIHSQHVDAFKADIEAVYRKHGLALRSSDPREAGIDVQEYAPSNAGLDEELNGADASSVERVHLAEVPEPAQSLLRAYLLVHPCWTWPTATDAAGQEVVSARTFQHFLASSGSRENGWLATREQR